MLKEQEGGKGSLKEVRIKPSFQKKKIMKLDNGIILSMS